METLPVEIIARITSFLPLDARRLRGTNKKFGEAFSLYHANKLIPVDLTCHTDSGEQDEGGTYKPMFLVIGMENCTVTFKVEGNSISLDKSTDPAVDFYKSFFTFAQICGIQKASFRKFLMDFLPLVSIKTLDMNVNSEKIMLIECAKPMSSFLLEAIRRKDCVKTIKHGNLTEYWERLFENGKRPAKEDRIRIFVDDMHFHRDREFYFGFTKYAYFCHEAGTAKRFVKSMMHMITNIYHHPEFAASQITFKGNPNLENYNFDRIFQNRFRYLPQIHVEKRDQFEAARQICDLPTEFSVGFIDKGGGLTVFLADDWEVATFLCVISD